MNIVEWAFGKRMTPAERLRKHQRALEKTQRELDRERVKLENQEKKLVADIKKSAKNGQMGPLRIQAKDLVRTRRYIQKFYQMRTQLQAISLRIQTVRSNEQMMQSMKGATTLLGSMNRQMNLPALQRIAMEFEKENDIMDQRQEMMDDAIDDATGMEDEEESEDVVNQVLDEIGIDLGQALGETPSGLQKNAVPEARVAQAIGGGGADPDDDDLQARLDSLRRARSGQHLVQKVYHSGLWCSVQFDRSAFKPAPRYAPACMQLSLDLADLAQSAGIDEAFGQPPTRIRRSHSHPLRRSPVNKRYRDPLKLAGNRRRSAQGGLLSKMFGNAKEDEGSTVETPAHNDAPKPATTASDNASAGATSANSNGSSSTDRKPSDSSQPAERKRRSSGVSRARDMFSSAKQSLHLGSSPTSHSNNAMSEKPVTQTPMQKLGKSDAALSVPQGSLNNSAGESAPGPRSTFRVGVTEDKNKKCRRTMEDTHAYLYNFLSTPAPSYGADKVRSVSDASSTLSDPSSQAVVETDNGYFAIFDGHAGTFAADWCGKKLHLILEETIRKNPNTPIPELLDQTFTVVDQQLEKLPLKNSGCTAVIAVLRWEDRVPNAQSSTGSVLFAPAAVSAIKHAGEGEAKDGADAAAPEQVAEQQVEARLRNEASRQRVLYTANVGDARIVLCRNGRALRLSYDHKGSDENEGRRVASAGGLILNNRVNGVLAVTRALGDAYMKDLVTGHPYTTETVIQADQDEFLILACDGLWDVCSDQEAVDLVRQVHDPQEASKKLVDYALARFSTDNLSCMVVRFDNKAIRQRKNDAMMGVDGDQATMKGGITEADAIVAQARKTIGEPETSVENAAKEIIMEEAEAEPGPELNIDAAKAARKHDV
ncbi:hypothetical protein CFE70_004770 [Pyrenophora teres f. teres 0-1]